MLPFFQNKVCDVHLFVNGASLELQYPQLWP